LNKPSFKFPVRIYYEDTDAGGVVYHANYLKYMERARTEWLRHMGYDLVELAREDNLMFVVAGVRLDFRRPARLNDLLQVTAVPSRLGHASLDVAQQVTRDEELLCSGTISLVTVRADDFRPGPMPSTMKQELAAWMPS